MGKDKTGQRTKNNVRPSSSGRSAEMLGTAPINPFMSFTTFKESMGLDDQMADSHLDPNFQVVLKKMNKKDGVTKLKALQEFSQLCSTSDADQVVAILPFWPRLYSSLALDVEHRVREAVHIAQRTVISKVKRNIAPYLKQLAGPWFVAQCDTYAPAASAASAAFNEAFPPNKLAEAVAFCQEEILNYIYENLMIHTPQTLCNAKTMTPEEIESKYVRTVSSSLQGYGLYLTRLTSEQLQSAKELNHKLVSDAKFWKFCKHQSPQVRSAWFSALIALAQHAQFLLSGEEKRVGQSVFGSLDEGEATVLPVVWEAALVGLVAMDGLLEAVSFEKLVLPKLLKVCREGGKGSAAAIFPSLLPLLSKMPSAVVKDTNTFHNKFFSSIQEGFSQRTVQQSSSESKAVASAYVECLQYIIQLNQGNETLCLELLQKYLLVSLCQSIQASKRAYTCEALYLSVSKLLHSWGRCPEDSPQRKFLLTFCNDISEALTSMALPDKVEPNFPQESSNPSEENEGHTNLPNVENNEDSPHKQVQATLKDVLRSQVDFVTSLLSKQDRQLKVTFADGKSQDMIEGGLSENCRTVPSEVTVIELKNLAKSLCCCYMQGIIKYESPEYISPLASLINILNTPSIYSDLAKCANVSSEQELFAEHIIKWLKPKSTLFCRASVSLSMPILKQLSAEKQNLMFHLLLEDGLKVNQLLWIIEQSTLHENAASNWLRSLDLVPVLKALAENATHSDNTVNAWKLFSSGFCIAEDGDHIFCHSAIENVLDVVVNRLEETWSEHFIVPSWTADAAEMLLEIYSEQSPFLRTLLSPERALSLVFKICIWESASSTDEEVLSTLWKCGAQALARMHGHSSLVVQQLGSYFVDAVLTMLYAKESVNQEELIHAASQVAHFVEIVTNCFLSVDGDKQRKSVCSLLLETLFSINPTDSVTGEASEQKAILALQRCGLESLADCVDPFHPGTDCSQNTPRSSMTELVGVGYWGAIQTYVLDQLMSLPSFETFNDEEDNAFFSLNVFLDVFVLSSDVGYISEHYPFTELGSTLLQLKKDLVSRLKSIISTLKPSYAEKIHELLLERSEKIAAYQRAHRFWHSFSAHFPSQYYECIRIVPISAQSVDDNTLQNIDLSPLDKFSGQLMEQNLNEEMRSQAKLWIDTVYKLQIHHNSRFVMNSTVDTYPVSVICDTSRVVKFLNAVVSRLPDLLEGRNWDQVMISMATWIHYAYESLYENPQEFSEVSLPRKLCAFMIGLCKLFVSFNQNLLKVKNGSIDLVDPERGSLKDSLPQEWQDVFAGECEHKILAIWTDIVENIKPSEESPPVLALLNHLGESLQICSTQFLQSSKEAEVTYEPLLKLAPAYLLHNLSSVRLTAFYLLFKIVPHMVKHDAARFADISNAGDEGQEHVNAEDRLSLLHFEEVLNQAQTVVSAMLSDIRLGRSCTVQPFTDAYTYTSGYLFVWSLLLEMCKEAETDLMCQYAMWLKNSSENYAETFLNNVFRLLPQEAFDEHMKKPLDFFSKGPNIFFGACWTSALVENLACNALYGVLSCLPALARQWYTNAEPKSATLIDRVVSKHFSPRICEAEMSAVAKMQDKAVENMTVRVHSNVREVVATYTVDDLAMELVVRIPTNHPLTPMVVEVGKRNAAAAVQWRQWLMQLTMFLTHQNGTLWDGLALWRNNVVRRYEGVEECYICFCVLSGSNYQLPKLSCRTCRKKFHSTCLYKWFQTSNKSSCPICRNLF